MHVLVKKMLIIRFSAVIIDTLLLDVHKWYEANDQ